MNTDRKRLLEITETPLPPAFDTPESYKQLNTILSYYGLTSIDPTDTFEAKLEKMDEILKSVHMETSLEDLEIVMERLKRIREMGILEAECDGKEIELANMRIASSSRYGGRSVEELKVILDDLRAVEGLSAESEMNASVLQGILAMRRESLECLGFMKEGTFGAYVKLKVMEKLEERNDDWARVLRRIVGCGECQVEEIRNELEVDRVGVLRIIYNLSAKGILEYDRLEDRVKIKTNC